MEFHQDGGKRNNLTLSQRSLLKRHRELGHIDFRSIIQFERLGLMLYILQQSKKQTFRDVQHVFLGGKVVHHLIQMVQEHVFQMKIINQYCEFQLIRLNLLKVD